MTTKTNNSCRRILFAKVSKNLSLPYNPQAPYNRYTHFTKKWGENISNIIQIEKYTHAQNAMHI
jgi:hypothetical protein